MKIRQIDITEALDLARADKKVFVISNPSKPIIKSFNNLPVGEVLADKGTYIFVVFEEE